LKLLFTFLLGLLGLRSLAQTGVAVPALAHCDATVQQFMQRWHVLGASVALAKDGKLVYERAFGYADVARTTPMQPYHLLRVASLSKSVTALAIMKLVEEGRLSLSHPVFGLEGYLGSAAYTQEIRDARLYRITVQQLLEHTAGWDRSIGCDGYGSCDPVEFPTHVAAVMGVANPVGDSTLIRYMLRQGLNFEPGTRFAYSNTGYLVLGKIIEAVTHQPYETWVREHVLQPSGVLEAHLGHNLPTARLERESAYQSAYHLPSCYNPALPVPAAYGGYQLEAMNAHGGWLFSARDLVRLLLATDGFASRPDLLSEATIRSMTQPSARNTYYAKGWMVNNGNWWHTGCLDGTASQLVRTAGGYTWVILLNTNNGSGQFWKELDALGWRWLAGTTTWPTHDLFAPEQAARAVQASERSASLTQLTWAVGSGTHRLVLLKADSPSTAFPVDGTAYPVASTLADGTRIVAVEQGTSAWLPPLDPQRTYYARVVEYRQDATTGQHPVYTLEDSPALVLGPVSGSQQLLALDTKPVRNKRRLGSALASLFSKAARPQGQLVAQGTLAPRPTIPGRQLPPKPHLLQPQEANRKSILRVTKH
jgi:CubicO group peptidase (beta-lactamase class C family)